MCSNRGQTGVPRRREEECKPEMGSSWSSCQKNKQMFQYYFFLTHLKGKLIYFELLYTEWFWREVGERSGNIFSFRVISEISS